MSVACSNVSDIDIIYVIVSYLDAANFGCVCFLNCDM